MKLRTLLLTAAALLAILVVGLVLFVMSFDVERFRPEIIAAAKRATGRELTLGGPLRLGLVPLRIEAERVAFANASWGSRPEMATIERFALELALRPLLLERRLVVRQVQLSGVDLLLETSSMGARNWELAAEAATTQGEPLAAPTAAAPEAEAVLPQVDAIALRSIALTWRDGQTGSETRAQIDRLSLARAEDATALDVVARYRATDVSLAGHIGPLATLGRPGIRFPLDLTMKAAGAQLHVTGVIEDTRALEGVDLRLEASGGSLADLSRLAGVALPSTEGWSLGGRVTHGSDAVWSFVDLAAKVGPSNLAGRATLTTAGARPKLDATLSSTLLATQDLAGGAWGDPSLPTTDAPASPAASAVPPPVSARGGALFSVAPLPYAVLERGDADVALQIARLEVKGATIADVAATLHLENGALDLALTQARIAGGSATADVDIVAAKQRVTARLQASDVGLGALAGDLGLARVLRGAAGAVDVDVEGQGVSAHELMRTLDGRATIDVGPGVLAASADELARTELARALLRGLVGGAETHLECMVGRFDVSGGLARTRVLFAKARQIDALGDGAIDLGSERIELYVIPRRGVLASGVNLDVSVPLRVSGPLASPAVTPSPIGTLQGTVGSVVPGALKESGSPLTLLLGDAGSTPSLDCAQARAIAAGQKPPWSGSSLHDPLRPIEKSFGELKEKLKDLFR